MNAQSPLKTNAGFTIIELIMATMLSALVLFVISIQVTLMSNFSKSLNTRIIKEDLQRAIILAPKSKKSIGHMCLHNSDFARCFVRGNNNCQSGEILPLTMYDSSGKQISGTTDNPLYVDKDGNTCDLASQNCAFRVEASFRPQGFASYCGDPCDDILPRNFPKAGSLHELMTIQYQIIPLENENAGKVILSEGSVTFQLDQLYNDGCPSI